LKLRAHKAARTAIAAAIALTTLALPLVDAAPAHAATAQSPAYFDRNAVIKRAMTWTRAHVPYNQAGWRDGYRTDCSGFVSMAWGLDQSYTTWSLTEVARPIHKDEMLPGDIMLNTADHVVIFGGWANRQHSRYIVLEEAHSTGGAVRREMNYPFWIDGNMYHPYRFVGGHNIKDPGNPVHEVQIQSYGGGGAVYVPAWVQNRLARPTAAAAKRPAAAPKRAAAKPPTNPVNTTTARARMAQKARKMASVSRARAWRQALAAARHAKAVEAARIAAAAEASRRAQERATLRVQQAARAKAAAKARAEEARRNRIGDRPLVVTLLQQVVSLVTK
jgi:hypothetical protein